MLSLSGLFNVVSFFDHLKYHPPGLICASLSTAMISTSLYWGFFTTPQIGLHWSQFIHIVDSLVSLGCIAGFKRCQTATKNARTADPSRDQSNIERDPVSVPHVRHHPPCQDDPSRSFHPPGCPPDFTTRSYTAACS